MRRYYWILLVFIPAFLQAQSIEGTWLFVDHKDGLAKSHVKIYEKNDLLFGRIVKFLPDATLRTCLNCKAELKGVSLLEMDVIYDLRKKGSKWDGKILDPEKDRRYSCQLSLEDDNTLKLRIYIGAVLFGKTLYWKKIL